MSSIGPIFVAVMGGIFLLAMLAVAVSQRAQTPSVISSFGNALSGIIGAAVAPVTGSQASNFGSDSLGSLSGLTSDIASLGNFNPIQGLTFN